MLKEISIENYKSLKNVTVQFKDGLNIIIGKNGSGKSNLLEFINMISFLSNVLYDPFKQRQSGNNYKLEYEQITDGKKVKLLVFSTTQKRQNGLQNEFLTHIEVKKIDDLTSEILFEDHFYSNENKDIKNTINEMGDFFTWKTFLIPYNLRSNLGWLDIPAQYLIDSDSGILHYENNSLHFR